MFGMKEVVETTYSCGHKTVVGGCAADPEGIYADSRRSETSKNKCEVCSDPERFPEIVKWNKNHLGAS